MMSTVVQAHANHTFVDAASIASKRLIPVWGASAVDEVRLCAVL